MSYPAKAIANYFINKAIKEKDNSLTLMKLLKLIYMAHGWCLAIYDKPLILDEIQAWKYGPVIPDIYKALKHFSIKPIISIIKEYKIDDVGNVSVDEFEQKFTKEISILLNKIWEVNKDITGIQLSNWSHDERGPW